MTGGDMLEGRTSRKTYFIQNLSLLLLVIFNIFLVINILSSGYDAKVFTVLVLISSTISFLIFGISIVTDIKRLRDLNRSGYISLINFLGFTLFLKAYLLFAKGDEGKNKIGEPESEFKNNRLPVLVIAFSILCMPFGLLKSKDSLVVLASHMEETGQLFIIAEEKTTPRRVTVKKPKPILIDDFNIERAKPKSQPERQVSRTRTKSNSSSRFTREYARLKSDLKRAPCSGDAIDDLLKFLLREKHPQFVFDHSQRFMESCGYDEVLLWRELNALKMMGKWDEYIATATQLIENHPSDPDYYGWRAQAYERTKKWNAAIADMKFALELNPELKDVPFKLAKLYKKVGQPCDVVDAISHYIEHYPESIAEESFRREVSSLYSSEFKKCPDQASGNTSWML